METLKMLDAPYRAAVVLLIDADGSVWLAQRSETCAVMPEQWECPAGKAEQEENFEEAAIREVFEETGLRISFERLVPCGITRTRGKGFMDCACALFMVTLGVTELPKNTEPNKRGPWLKLDFPNECWGIDFTLGTDILLSILAEDLAVERVS